MTRCSTWVADTSSPGRARFHSETMRSIASSATSLWYLDAKTLYQEHLPPRPWWLTGLRAVGSQPAADDPETVGSWLPGATQTRANGGQALG